MTTVNDDGIIYSRCMLKCGRWSILIKIYTTIENSIHTYTLLYINGIEKSMESRLKPLATSLLLKCTHANIKVTYSTKTLDDISISNCNLYNFPTNCTWKFFLTIYVFINV